ncbi:hypothetical protein [Streptomyces sp. H27-C3]|uniref:hypothetical protein n=1 Tax=Streptomyces sp. H27-C3 TaxID=3046305 RepID=UPI0024B90E50|nr:hypothetical protein [Streptomyces sp. H27-C3]MDJ0465608.1 hypothetical protein [Streptomyces sp. H27-C3]
MVSMRRAMVAVAGAVMAVVGVAGVSSGAGARAGGGGIAPEADVAYHGHVTVREGRLGVWLVVANHGPSGVADATVRLRFSVPLAGAQALPSGCLRTGPDEVLCGAGMLRAGGGAGRGLDLALRVPVRTVEVTARIDTAWNGGASDRNPQNNEHRVLAPATGDRYFF